MGKKQRHKEKLKLAGLDSDSSALTQSGDEERVSSPPPQGPSGPGTEVGTEAGEEGDVEMAERSSPGQLLPVSGFGTGAYSHFASSWAEPVPVPKPTKTQKGPKKGAFTRTRSSVAAASSTRTTKKRKR